MMSLRPPYRKDRLKNLFQSGTFSAILASTIMAPSASTPLRNSGPGSVEKNVFFSDLLRNVRPHVERLHDGVDRGRVVALCRSAVAALWALTMALVSSGFFSTNAGLAIDRGLVLPIGVSYGSQIGVPQPFTIVNAQ